MSAPRIGSDGLHFKQQGKAVGLTQRFSSVHRLPPVLSTFSWRDPRIADGRALVVLETNSEPFVFNAHVSPDEARALAANLLQAADEAEQVQAVLDARAGKCATRQGVAA